MESRTKGITTLTVLWMLPFFMVAQSSMEHRYVGLQGDDAVMCTDQSNGNSIICYQNASTSLPCFVYHKHTGSSTNRYQCVENPNPSGFPYSYKVSDIEIIDEYCYFCGTFITTTLEAVAEAGNTFIEVRTETGFVGRFLLSDITNGYNLYIQFVTIPGTTEFHKLEGFSSGTYNIISLIGTADPNHEVSCLALLKDNGGNSSKYGLYTMPDDEETLTDVDVWSSYIMTASKFKHRQYEFGLRADELMDIDNSLVNNTPLPRYMYINTINTSSTNTIPDPRPSNPTEYSNNADILLSGWYYNIGYVTVAYDCFGGATDVVCNTDNYHTVLFTIDNTSYEPTQQQDMIVTQAMLLSRQGGEKSSLIQLMSPDYKSSFLLHRYSTSNNEIRNEIQIPSWLTYGLVDDLTTDCRTLSDMYLDLNRERVNFVGIEENNNILHFTQDVNQLTKSCYSTRPQAYSEELDLPVSNLDNSPLNHTYGTVQWGNARNISPQTTNYGVECKTN